ncbi:MAG: hypothetical protein ABL964_07410 [Steroidobacteraceae bacterium]
MRTRFIVATRHDEDAFFRSSLLAQSLEQFVTSAEFLLEPAFQSSAGLASVYNPAIERSQPGDRLVFIHDDVYIDDWHFDTRLREALAAFDVVGVAGAIARTSRQPAWWATESRGNLVPTGPGTQSGAIKHIKPRRRRSWARFIESGLAHVAPGRGAWRKLWTANPDGSYVLSPVDNKGDAAPSVRHAGSGAGKLDSFGPAPAAVKLLDGVFLAVRADRLLTSAVRFDPRFQYHFYDLDFCRQCETAGLTMGTWPISLTHGSYGGWGDGWRKAKNIYLDKWRD